jgi:hypothetical protein
VPSPTHTISFVVPSANTYKQRTPFDDAVQGERYRE